MKIYFTLFMLFFFAFSVHSQSLVRSVNIDHDNIPLRFPAETILGKIDMDIPSDGMVLVRFDGNCKVTQGDRIILAASNDGNWDTNDGNLGLTTFNDNTPQPFAHQRAYPVSKGIQSFYAVGHNYVDRQGSGAASIHGDLTVLFFPDPTIEKLVTTNLVIDNQLIEQTSTIVKNVNISTPAKGKILVSTNFALYANEEDEIEVALNDSPLWPEGDYLHLDVVSYKYYRMVTYNRIIDVDMGNHDIYLLARRITGDILDTNNGFYGSMSVQFYPDTDDPNLFTYTTFQQEVLNEKSFATPLCKASLTVPNRGQVLVQIQGKLKADKNAVALFSILSGQNPDQNAAGQRFQMLHDKHDEECFSVSNVYEVDKGVNEFYLFGGYEQNGSTFEDGFVSGNFTLTYIAAPQTSSSGHKLTQNTNITFYPNPTTGPITLIYRTDFSNNLYDINVFDIRGNLLKAFKNIGNTALNLSELHNGIYILKIISNGQTITTQKVIKHN